MHEIFIGTIIGPECFRFGIIILFDNSDHDGQIVIELKSLPERLHCPNADGGENTIESIRLKSNIEYQILLYSSNLVFEIF